LLSASTISSRSIDSPEPEETLQTSWVGSSNKESEVTEVSI